MARLIQFFYLFLGVFLLTPAQANSRKRSIRYWRRSINKQLKFGHRVLQIPNEFFAILVQELREKGWHVKIGLGQHSNKSRDIYVVGG